jgi:DNA-binding MarR family transcriptional regulator
MMTGRTGGGTVVTGRSRLANEAWEALLVAHAALVKEFAAQGIWRDLSMREYDVLYTLARRRDPVRLGELNRFVLLSQPALSRLVDRLVERGLLRREADPADGRGVRLCLTDDGAAAQRELGRRHARDVARAMHARITGDELAELTAICRRLAAGAGTAPGRTRDNATRPGPLGHGTRPP